MGCKCSDAGAMVGPLSVRRWEKLSTLLFVNQRVWVQVALAEEKEILKIQTGVIRFVAL